MLNSKSNPLNGFIGQALKNQTMLIESYALSFSQASYVAILNGRDNNFTEALAQLPEYTHTKHDKDALKTSADNLSVSKPSEVLTVDYRKPSNIARACIMQAKNRAREFYEALRTVDGKLSNAKATDAEQAQALQYSEVIADEFTGQYNTLHGLGVTAQNAISEKSKSTAAVNKAKKVEAEAEAKKAEVIATLAREANTFSLDKLIADILQGNSHALSIASRIVEAYKVHDLSVLKAEAEAEAVKASKSKAKKAA